MSSLSLHQRGSGRKLPPFGRELLELRKRGLVPTRPLVVGIDNWRWGSTQPRVVLPPDLDPADCDFCFLAGLDVEVVWSASLTTIERRDATLKAIIRVSPSFLWLIDVDRPERGFVVVSRRDGLLLPEYAL